MMNSPKDKTPEAKTPSVNTYVRNLTLIALFVLTVMVIVSFIFGTPPFTFSTATITVLLIIVVLLLSETFTTLSIGQILSLSRTVSQKSEENNQLKNENQQLREQVIRIATTVTQSQVNTTLNGVPLDILSRLLGVTPAKEEALEEQAEEWQHLLEDRQRRLNVQAENLPEEDAQRPPRLSFYQIRPFVEEEAFMRYAEQYQLPVSSFVRDVQFTPMFQGLDPIAERRVIFDAYMRLPQIEYFFEVVPKNTLGRIPYEPRLYELLSKILYYRQAKNIQATLILLVVELPDDEQRMGDRLERNYTRFIEAFQPAISNTLLRVETISLTDEDYARLEQRVPARQGGR